MPARWLPGAARLRPGRLPAAARRWFPAAAGPGLRPGRPGLPAAAGRAGRLPAPAPGRLPAAPSRRRLRHPAVRWTAAVQRR
ncbi:hypothetical protein FK530_06350 [Tsukamurella conjunctivitidis]|uniref:Uncharacterized protein n=1 Tax=Tsukamurella conjunctivitidis TaxID=2592068 RepID=A0A5C5S6T3_9ACTN|nr:hypothetical protein FK530_06350 [Tsukamurella conjunctivitidis]